jgi:hypothetical protein
MLVWDMPDGPQNVSLRGCAPAGAGVGTAYEGYLSVYSRIIRRHTVEYIDFEPTKLSMAMIGAFKAMGGRVAVCAETSYAQWQQFVVCASQAVARRSRSEWVRPVLAVPVTAVRRVKAFFVAQKVNGRNAP